MKNHFSRKLVCLLVATGCVSMSHSVAQGLKGSEGYGPHEILGRRAYIRGANDTERWKTLQMVQSKLLGMDCKQVVAALGEANTGKDTYSYAITQEPISTNPKRWAQLRLFFTNGRVSKFSVEAEQR
jgi:hypothetical protein